jgi:hypothetical protein
MIKESIRRVLRAFGWDLVRYEPSSAALPDTTPDERSILDRISPYTMTSRERQLAVIHATRYVTRRKIPGCFVECGVWRGGSSMAAALTLMQEGDAGRHLYLYDTFAGMTPPTAADRSVDGTSAATLLEEDRSKSTWWCIADLNDVEQNMRTTGYPQERLHFIQGPVESTLPEGAPNEPIAVLRLDTDWYESTRHELTHLFPRLVEGGVLIIDDYGHWQGARKAVDEFLASIPHTFFMHRIDYTGRLLVKQ